jgi:hypothetical protein
MIESNSIMKFLRPDIYLTVLDPRTADFKQSALEFLDRADAILMHEGADLPAWDRVSLKLLEGKPVFQVHPPEYVSTELVSFVRERLGRK